MVIPLLPPPKQNERLGLWVPENLEAFSFRFWRFNLTDGWLNIFEKSFGEIAEVFKDRRNGVHPGLNWENDAPQHSAPTNSSGFPKPELGRAILMEASGLKFTPHRGFFYKRIPKAGFVCFFCDGFFNHLKEKQ